MIPANGTFVQGVTTISDDELNTLVQGCTATAQLRTFVGLSNMTVMLLGISGPGDGSGGVFYWQNGQGFTDDNYNVIVPQGVTRGAWLRAALQTQAYSCDFEYIGPTPPQNSQYIGIHVFTEDVTFPANFSGSEASIIGPPTDQVLIDIRDTGSSVGTFTINTDGTWSFGTHTGEAVSYTTGERMVFQAPANSDATLNYFGWRMIGATAP